MKKHIIVATVFVAIGMPAWAHPDTAFGLRSPASSSDDKKKSETDKDKKSEESSTASSSNDRNTVVKTGFVDNEGRVGDLVVTEIPSGTDKEKGEKQTVAIFTPEGCTGDISCKKQVLVDGKVTEPFRELEAKIRKSMADQKAEPATSRRNSLHSDRGSDISVADFKEEFQEDLHGTLETECGIEPKDIRVSTSQESLQSRTIRGNPHLMTALAGTQWAGLEIPQRNEKAACAANVIAEFMNEKEDEFNEESFEFDESSRREISEKIREKRREISDLKQDLRRADTNTQKSRIQTSLNAREKELQDLRAEESAIKKEVENRKRKVGAANDVMKRFVDTYFIRSATLDVASGNGVGLNYLHELASATPDSFKGVRDAAANALLNVYRVQAQSQLALTDAANKTTDPNLKLQFQNAALQFGQAGMNHNSTMINPATRQEMYNRAYNQYLSSNSLTPWSPSFEEVRAAQNYATSVVNSTMTNYTTGAQQITNYLATNATNPAAGSAMPQLLQQNGTWIPNTGISTGRAHTRRAAPQGGQSAIIRGQRPTVLPP